MCLIVQRTHRWRWWLVACYVSSALAVAMILGGFIISGTRPAPHMNHYIYYERFWYGPLIFQIAAWQWFGIGVGVYEAWRVKGYDRTRIVYFVACWVIGFVTTNSIIVPIEYGINIPPFGFFVFPFVMAMMAYALSKARLDDFNVVIARVMLTTFTLVVVMAVCFVFVAGMTLVAPGFMEMQQILVTVVQGIMIGLALTIGLPRMMPRAERLMQERLLGAGPTYRVALAGLLKELWRLPTIDQVFASVATTVHYQMQVSHAMILFQNPHLGLYQLQAQSGLSSDAVASIPDLSEDSATMRWLRQQKDVLVREEIARLEGASTREALMSEMERLKAWVCVPMFLDDRLMGMVVLGGKLNRDMFFISDLKLLGNLAAEVGLAVKYRHLEEEVARKNKLVELGTIAAGVAHEIRNPLASVRTFAQLLPERIDDQEFRDEFSKLVLKDVDRISKVVESMLAFARPGQVSVSEHAATELVDEAILLVQSRLKSKSVHLVKEHHQQPLLQVDKQQMLQVLVNLLINAVDALPSRGEIRVSTGVRWMEAGEAGHRQQMAVIEITDNGPGIPPNVRNRLFDPFFTTKKEGTGLGLSISQKIARDHGGIITVSSVEGKGTTFRVNLPLS
jgi:signal transduction histidine kinase